MAEMTFTDANFSDTVLKNNKLVVVDFYAVWCGPCQMMAPHIEEIANENNNVVIGKLNVDDNNATATQYQVLSIPTIIYFKNGQVVDKTVGYQSKEAIEEKIKELS